MGTVYMAECSCGYKHSRITAGCGLGAQNEGMIKRGVPESVYQAFTEERSKGGVDDYFLGNAVTVCRRCQEINVVSRFCYKLKNSGKEFLYIADCPKCGGKTEEISDIGSIICPKCGKKMDIWEIGFWD